MSYFSLTDSKWSGLLLTLIFATLHFAVALISRILHYYDDIPLTILTLTMVIVISLRNNTRAEIMAIIMLAATLTGFVIGSWLRKPLTDIIHNEYLAPAISTFAITTLLGMAIDTFTRKTKRLHRKSNSWRISTRTVVIAAISILILRMSYIVMTRAEIITEGELLSDILNISSSTWSLLILLVGNTLLTLRTKGEKREMMNIATVISVVVITTAVSATVYYDLPQMSSQHSTLLDFVRIFAAALIIELLAVTLCYLIITLFTSRRELREERELKHRTEYQYERLKQQINPHFLFNSLNILDYLVQEHETERASLFIRKLANIYRYMLNTDQKPLIKLSEEMDFTNMYIDLLQERFAEGMIIVRDIDQDSLNRYVVPCSLQLLVENATKHNIVAVDTPLTITIRAEQDYLVVTNNLQERRHGQPSTHLGLANIQRQYLDITRRDIVVTKTDVEFTVKLPIV